MKLPGNVMLLYGVKTRGLYVNTYTYDHNMSLIKKKNTDEPTLIYVQMESTLDVVNMPIHMWTTQAVKT